MKAHFRIGKLFGYPGITAISVSVYLAASKFTYRMGFPLDDAWIHQTYARNLGLYGDWAYLPGQPSAGSTAPLWSGLLAVGHYLGLGPYLWTYLLGWMFFFSMVLLGVNLFRQIDPVHERWGYLAGVLLVFEWHLVWAAVSGMETILFTCLVLVVFGFLLLQKKRWFLLGIVVGLSVYVRPDGLTLLLPVLFVLMLERSHWRMKIYPALQTLIGLGLLFGPFLLLNVTLSGSYWPNTFYAKQAEYSIELMEPLFFRLVEQFQLPLVGVGIALLPGFIHFVYEAIKRQNWVRLSMAIWAIGYLVLYALRLPVTYQHGRYAIPMMALFFICGFGGTLTWIRLNSPALIKRILSRSLVISGAVILIMFWLLGARAYARDVAIIESEMVDTARWIAANTEEGAVVAAHDIGALGYFGERLLVDLAGLVSPEVIPFIRDEGLLAEYLHEQDAGYLVTFPNWYPFLVRDLIPIFRTNSPFAPQQGGENMTVYRWGT